MLPKRKGRIWNPPLRVWWLDQFIVGRGGLAPPAFPNAMISKAFPSGEGGRHGAKRSWLTDEEKKLV